MNETDAIVYALSTEYGLPLEVVGSLGTWGTHRRLCLRTARIGGHGQFFAKEQMLSASPRQFLTAVEANAVAASSGLAPSPVVSRAGELVVSVDGRLWTLTEWCTGKAGSRADLSLAGQRLAALHQALAVLRARVSWSLPPDRASKCPDTAGPLVDRLNLLRCAVSDGVWHAVEPVLRRIGDLPWSTMSTGVIHGEVALDNMLVCSRNVIWIDFDRVRLGYLAWDIAQLVAFWAVSRPTGPISRAELCEAALTEVVDGYAQIDFDNDRAMTVTMEARALLPVALICAWISHTDLDDSALPTASDLEYGTRVVAALANRLL